MARDPLQPRELVVLGVLTACVVGSFVALCYLVYHLWRQ